MTDEERSRYARHLNLPDFSQVEQDKLKNASVLMVGAGGLGCPVALYLAAAGVGILGIIDDDIVELSNLQRQVLYTTQDLGLSKAQVAARRLADLNPHITIQAHEARLTRANALEVLRDYDIIVDGTDNFATRYLVNDACVILGKTNVYASIYQYEGQVSVFNLKDVNNTYGPNYRDLYPEPPTAGLVPDCATGGVLGVLAGIIGTFQALEVIKVITGIGEPLAGRLLLYDAKSVTLRTIKYTHAKNTKPITDLIDYDQFCGTTTIEENMKEITVQELKAWQENGHNHQLIDVREKHEVDFVSIGGENIALGDLLSSTDKIAQDKDVVLMCRSGSRSAAALNALSQQGINNLYNLKGGILAWAKEIDTSLPTY